MTSRNLITILSKKYEIDEKKTEDYLKRLVDSVISRLGKDEKVSFLGIGEFTVEKEEEYLLIDEISGCRTLYPPKLVVKFKADNTSEAKNDYDTLSQSITEIVYTQKYVKIEHFGTFKLIGEKDDTNGELMFTPCETFEDTINYPFQHFKPVAINENIDFTDLKVVRIANDEEIDKEETNQEANNVDAEISNEQDHNDDIAENKSNTLKLLAIIIALVLILSSIVLAVLYFQDAQ